MSKKGAATSRPDQTRSSAYVSGGQRDQTQYATVALLHQRIKPGLDGAKHELAVARTRRARAPSRDAPRCQRVWQSQSAHGTTGHAGHGAPSGHDRHEGHSVAMFRDRFWITLLLSIPTLLWSGMVQHMVGFSAPAFPGFRTFPHSSARPCTCTAARCF
jgi:hypothetical protein